MAYTDFGFMRPDGQDGPISNFFKRLFVPQQGLVGQVPATAPEKKEPQNQFDKYTNQRVQEIAGSGLLQGMRERQLKKSLEKGEVENSPFKPGFSKKQAEVPLPRSFNQNYLEYMQQPGFVERLGREMYGPSYKYGTNAENDKAIKERYGQMISNVKNTRGSIYNVGFMPFAAKYYPNRKGGEIEFASPMTALSRPTYMHEFSHAMYPQETSDAQRFYETIPGTQANIAKQKMAEEQAKMSQIRGIIGQNMELAGIKPKPAQGGPDEDYYIRRALEEPTKYGGFINNEQLMKYYNALPEEKRTVQYNPQEYSAIRNAASNMSVSEEATPTEVRARVTALRDAMIKQGFPQNRTYTKDKLEKAMKGKGFNDMGSYNDLKKEAGLSDDQIIYLLNNLAQAPQRQSQFQAIQQMTG